MQNQIGKYVIISGDRSGVFFGKLVAKENREVELTECRRLWYWDGAASISELALSGTTCPDNCKFTVSLAQAVITDAIEILTCSEKSIKSIKGVKEWKIG